MTRCEASDIAPQGLRDTLGHFVTGVSVVTTINDKGELCGLTANSFTSVSLEPPLILVCVNYSARSYAAITESRRFAVHILREDQADLARAFATGGADRSGFENWHINERRYAKLDQYHAALECRLHKEFHGGDHAILVGHVEALDIDAAKAPPLVFYKGQFVGLNSAAA